jgi:hypothetical protein
LFVCLFVCLFISLFSSVPTYLVDVVCHACRMSIVATMMI